MQRNLQHGVLDSFTPGAVHWVAHSSAAQVARKSKRRCCRRTQRKKGNGRYNILVGSPKAKPDVGVRDRRYRATVYPILR